MKIALAVLIALHGLIHLVGPATAFGWWDVSQLRYPIPPVGGMLWLLTAALLIVAAIAIAVGAHWWWYFALAGVLLSQFLVVQAWSDARFGALASVCRRRRHLPGEDRRTLRDFGHERAVVDADLHVRRSERNSRRHARRCELDPVERRMDGRTIHDSRHCIQRLEVTARILDRRRDECVA